MVQVPSSILPPGTQCLYQGPEMLLFWIMRTKPREWQDNVLEKTQVLVTLWRREIMLALAYIVLDFYIIEK